MYKSLIFLSLFCVSYSVPISPDLNKILINQKTINQKTINQKLLKNNTCILCEKLITIIYYDSGKLNKTITDILIVIRDICLSISGPSGKECVFILDDIQKIMKMISNGLTPIAICKDLGFCKIYRRCNHDF